MNRGRVRTVIPGAAGRDFHNDPLRPGHETTHPPGEAVLRMADVVVAATPCDFAALPGLANPVVRARYDFAKAGEPRLPDLVIAFLRARGLV